MIWRCDLLPQYLSLEQELLVAYRRVMESGRYLLGRELKSFEESFAAYIGVKHAVGVANGTDGLILALRALNIGEGDEVITSPFTAIPTVSAIIDAGAKPVFVDVCPETYLIDIGRIKDAVTSKTRAVMPVHIFGNVVDVEAIRPEIGSGIAIIEDACQSHGSKIHGRMSGSMGDLGIFSFYPSKNLGAYGDGGMVVAGEPGLAERLKLLRMYGMTDYNHIVINGINSRLDELQAAFLQVKLKYLDANNEKRNTFAARYKKELDSDFIFHQFIPPAVFSNYHVFVSRVPEYRDELVRHLEKEGIQTNVYYLIPLHLQKALEYLGYRRGDFPQAEKLCAEVIALPMYPEMTADTQAMVIERINGFLRKNG